MLELPCLRPPVLTLAVCLATACGNGAMDDVDGGGTTCSTDLDCDDGFECTLDSCGVGSVCRHDAIDERCEDGLSCEVGRGCVSSSSCSSDAECDDDVDCTLDSCGVGGLCNNTALDERCSAPTTMCDPAMGGCVEPGGCSSDAECDDGVECTRDSCTVDRECRNTALNELCDTDAGEVCQATMGCIVPMPCDDASDCQDGNFCNGAEVCDPEFGCGPAEAPRECDDSDDCTLDSCDESANMCVFACDTSRTECDCPAPPATCDGRFNLPGASGSCLGLWSWDFTTVRFTNVGGAIEVTEWTVDSSASAPPMADPGPACPDVDASTMIGAGGMAGCSETYRIQGTFVDADTFMGTFTAEFEGSLLGTDCSMCNMTVSLTGSRI
ncbi:MAG TPA: hypothetical protein RMH99_08730 [Sandaracinaceae bacterium LLY-WYZ-13_1]|nr:hypothetical protein [Sandaracinaceae bacterium LLY-WYZ-13_1]